MQVGHNRRRGDPDFGGSALGYGSLEDIWDWIETNSKVGNELTQWNARKRKEYQDYLDKWYEEHPNEPPPDPGKDVDPGMGPGEYDDPAEKPWSWKDVLSWIASTGKDVLRGDWLGAGEQIWDAIAGADIDWDSIERALKGKGLTPEDIANARDQFDQYRKDSDARFKNRRGNEPGSPGEEETDPNNPGGGAGGVGTPRDGGVRPDGGGGGNYDFTPNWDPRDPSTWPAQMGNTDYGWGDAAQQYGPMLNLPGMGGGGGNPFMNGGGDMGAGGGNYGGGYDQGGGNYAGGGGNMGWGGGGGGNAGPDPYYGVPGGGDPRYQQRRPDFRGSRDLDRLAYSSENRPNATIDFERNPFSQQYGYGGQMVKYNEMPQFQAASAQIDEQTEQEIAQQAEDFGGSGMRWSSALADAMGKTRRGAAADKNKLMLDMDREESQKAWERQMQEAGQMREDYMGQTGLDWDVARTKGQLQNQMGNQTFQNVMGLDAQRFDQNRYFQDRDYREYVDQYGRQNDMEQRSYGRWLTNDQNEFQRQQEAAMLAMQLGGQENQYGRDLFQDLWGMGRDERGMENADNEALYREWLRAQGGWDQEIGGFTGGGAGGPQFKAPGGKWWEDPRIWEAIGGVVGGYFGDEGE